MATTLADPQPALKGYETRKLRQAVGMSIQQVADLSGVSRAHVVFLEKHYPVPLDSKRRILATLWAKKARK